MKLYIQLTLLFITLIYSIALGLVLSEPIIIAKEYMFYHRSYIENIHTPSYTNTKEVLLEFDSLADGGIVLFKGTRPITIQEQSIFMQIIYPTAIGLAFSTLNDCRIYIRTGLDKTTFRETLIHELCHCFGYKHSPDYKDLMYYSMVAIDKEENIKYYAKDIKNKYYAPRFYRF